MKSRLEKVWVIMAQWCLGPGGAGRGRAGGGGQETGEEQQAAQRAARPSTNRQPHLKLTHFCDCIGAQLHSDLPRPDWAGLVGPLYLYWSAVSEAGEASDSSEIKTKKKICYEIDRVFNNYFFKNVKRRRISYFCW